MNDDLDDEIIDSEDGFDEFSQSSNLGDNVRNNPVVKIIIAVVAVAVIIGVVVMFGGSDTKDNKSVVTGDVDVTAAPGEGDSVNLAYKEAIQRKNEEDLEDAYAQGGSSIPIPVETRNVRLEIPETQEEEEDPLHRWRMLQEERINREMQAKDTAAEPVTVLDAEQQSEAIRSLSESMMQQMQSVLGVSSGGKTMVTKNLIVYSDRTDSMAEGGTNVEDGAVSDEFVEDVEEVVIVPAGKIVYGQFLLEANSDAPSVILVQMVSGPLKGWKLLGSFSLEEDLKMLTVSFNMAVNEDGDQYPVSAIMLDPDTSLAAKATEVNNRYFKRIVLPAAAAFVKGFADAVSESGRTTITVSGTGDGVVSEESEKDDEQEVSTGVKEAATVVSDILDDMADVPVQVIINAGTPIGIFFTENVVDTEGDI